MSPAGRDASVAPARLPVRALLDKPAVARANESAIAFENRYKTRMSIGQFQDAVNAVNRISREKTREPSGFLGHRTVRARAGIGKRLLYGSIAINNLLFVFDTVLD